MTIQELTRDQKDELKWALWWESEDDVFITDEALYNVFGGIEFVNDDFFCSIGQ